MHPHASSYGLGGNHQKAAFLRFIYLLEGSAFLLLNLALHRVKSITLMLSLSLACTLSFTLPYGLARSSDYFNGPFFPPSSGLRVHQRNQRQTTPLCPQEPHLDELFLS